MFDRKRRNVIDTLHEKKFIKSLFKDSIIKIFEINGAYIAGGCIRSIFTSQKINDIDIFFRNKEGYLAVKSHFEKDRDFKLLSNTCNADTFETKSVAVMGGKKQQVELTYGPAYLTDNDIKIQLVNIEFDEPIGTLARFDFRCCMAAFDFLNDTFIFDDNFMNDNARRIIHFNIDCWHPLSSLFRLQKYQQRGYRITDESLLLLGLVISQSNFTDYSDLLKELKTVPQNKAARNLASYNDLHPWDKNKNLLDAPVNIEQVDEWLRSDYMLYDNERAIQSKETDTHRKDCGYIG